MNSRRSAQSSWDHGKSVRIAFSDNDLKYIRCCCHVRKSSIVMSSILMVLCVASVSVLTVAFLYPKSHEYLNSEKINLEYKTHRDSFELAYRITVGVLGVGFTIHLISLALCLIGILKNIPSLLIPELIIMSLLSGVLLFGSVSLAISMIIILGFLWILTTINAVSVLFTSYYLYILIYCFRYIRDKRKSMDNELRKSKYERPEKSF